MHNLIQVKLKVEAPCHIELGEINTGTNGKKTLMVCSLNFFLFVKKIHYRRVSSLPFICGSIPTSAPAYGFSCLNLYSSPELVVVSQTFELKVCKI